MDTSDLQDQLTLGSLGFGVTAALAPGVIAAVYRLEGDDNLAIMTRLWGTAVAGHSAVALLSDDEDLKMLLAQVAVAMNLANAALIATTTSGLKSSGRALGVVTSLAFAAGFGARALGKA